MKRVLLLTPACQGFDGLSAFSRLCIDALAESGCDLEVWSLAGIDDREHPLPKSVKFAGGNKKRFAWRGLRAALRPPDVVFCTHVNMSPIALPMTTLGARLIVSLLGVEAWKPLRFRERLAVRRAKRLVAISQFTADGFRAANPELKSVALEVCHLCLPEPTKDRVEKQLNPRKPFGLIVARMAAEERYKGHDLLLDVWNEVREQAPLARLVVAGGGDDRGRLEAKRDALGLQESIEFVGRVSDDELQSLYRDCAFFVMPSRGEGFGLVFLEAMRAGKACIGAIGSASEIIAHAETGFVFDAADRTSIRDACIRLFNDPEFAARLGGSGRRREAETFDRESFGKRLRELVLERT